MVVEIFVTPDLTLQEQLKLSAHLLYVGGSRTFSDNNYFASFDWD